MKRFCVHVTIFSTVVFLLLVMQAGCGGKPSKPSVLTFSSKDSKSAKEFKQTLDKLKKKYEGRVVFIDYDMKNTKNKKIIEKYHVTMDPTYVVLNAKGEVKETFLGKPYEEMLRGAIESYIPHKGKNAPQTSTPSISVPTPLSTEPIPGTKSTP
ncbi:MAG: hypothetical protein PHP64_00210 [Actinomycetota bacterium]|nr:hypothetical protein [Actinomycetota bacterium]